jgi:2-keto-3-deoxy-L-rhamnonate aldolase RhmA
MPTEVAVKKKIKAGDFVVGTMSLDFHVPGLPAMAAASGAEFLLLDMEHTGAGFETLKMLCAACRGLPIAPVIRVPVPSYEYVAQAFDIGAHGVMVPMVDTVEQAKLIAAAAHYPPYGRRGAAMGIAHDDYTGGDPVQKLAKARERNFVIAQIESPTGVANSEAIAAVDGIDVLWVGHFDLSNFMGIPGQFSHPDFDAALAHVGKVSKAAGKAAGLMAADVAWTRRVRDLGYTVIAQGVDHAHYQNSLRKDLEAARAL